MNVLTGTASRQIDAVKPTPFLPFKMDGKHFFYLQQGLFLDDSPLTAKLFKLFFTYPYEIVYKDEILEFVYGLNLEQRHTDRLIIAYGHNVIKLISRARQLAEKTWGQTSSEGELCWFKYDNLHEGWHLLRTKKRKNTRDLRQTLH